MPRRQTNSVLNEALDPTPIEDKVEQVGYATPSAIALMAGRTLDEVFYAAKKGWLGRSKTRAGGKREYYSIAQAELLYARLFTVEQKRAAITKDKNDRQKALLKIAQLCRDLAWVKANEHVKNLVHPEPPQEIQNAGELLS